MPSIDTLTLPNLTWYKAFAWLFFTIFIGSLSTPFWEYILSPAILKSRDFVLNIKLRWLKSYKDSTYLEIAKGHGEHAGAKLLSIVLAAQVVIAITLTGSGIITLKNLNRRADSVSQRITYLIENKKPMPQPEDSPTSLLSELEATKKTISTLLYVVYFFYIPFCLFLLYSNFTDSLQITYVDGAISHFEQLLHIIRPYIDEKTHHHFLSRFALISCHEDYENLITEVQSIGSTQKLQLPKFKIW